MEVDADGQLWEPFVDEYGQSLLEYSDTELGEDAVAAAAVTVLRAVRAVESEHSAEAAVGVVEGAAFARAADNDRRANRVCEAWSDALDAESKKKLMARRTDIDEFNVHGREVCWLPRKKPSESTFSNAALEKTIGKQSTLRGLNTVKKMQRSTRRVDVIGFAR